MGLHAPNSLKAPVAALLHKQRCQPKGLLDKTYSITVLLFSRLQDGLYNCGGVQKLGESASVNKCCELCWCMVSGEK